MLEARQLARTRGNADNEEIPQPDGKIGYVDICSQNVKETLNNGG
jgi:hypothetical protein